METKSNVALLGLGTMGHGMGMNLLKAGFPLTVYNRTPERAESLRAAGAAVADTPAAAARNAAVVIAMLSDDAASRTVWLGTDGALAAMLKGSVAVECSTLSPGWIAELDAAARARGLGMVEAPVTGSREQADSAQLNILAGADPETLQKVTPVLSRISKSILHLGPVGSGAQLKLINNFLCAVQTASFAEALTWIGRTELQPKTALEFLKNGAPGSGILKAMADRMTKGTYEVNFLLRLMAKDVRYARAAAAALGVELSTAGPVEAMFQKAQDQGHGEQDMSAVLEAVHQRSAAEPGSPERE
ncbi:MAG: NAD(P)-dependent oxidoreductase [Acidobacteriaceae bacterium]